MERTFHMLLYRAFHAQRNFLRPCLGQIGLEVGQPKLLTYLEKNGPCQQNQLAEYFEVDSAAISRMLNSLEKGGFVTRQANEANRRSNRIELTEKGRRAVSEWQGHCREMEDIMLRGFSEEEKAQFAAFLTRAYRNIHDEKEAPSCGI